MINVTELKRNLKQNKIDNLYLFCGEENYLIDTYVKKITDMAIGDGIRDFNCTVYDEDNESFEGFVNEIESYPTMSERKVVVLKNVKFITLKDYQKPMAEVLETLPEYVVVIIVEQDVSKIKKGLRDIIDKKGTVVDFKKQSIADLRAWVNLKFSKADKQMTPADMEYLITLCERSLEKLTVECDKLISGAEQPQITRQMIDTLVKIPVEYKIFEMADELLTGNAEAVYKILNGFKIAKVQPIVIFSVLYGQISDLLMFKLVSGEGQNPADLLASNKKWMSQKLSANSKKYSEIKLRQGMKLCAKYDLDVKMGSIDGYTAVEMLVAEILDTK